jgi:LNS2 (Lipin/Ned1/Smp2)
MLLGLNGCARKHLFPEDAIIQQGATGQLAAAVDSQRLVIFTKGVPQTQVEFTVNGRTVGSDDTDSTGRASIQASPGESTSSFTARTSIDGKEVEAEGKIYYWDADKPAIAVDIDETISLSEYINLIWGDGLSSKPLNDSAEVVRTLAKDYQILYYSIRPRFMMERTRKWLEKNGFPDGPVIYTDSFHAAFHQTRRKREMLAELRSRWPNVQIGIGDKLTDVISCNDNNMLSVIVNNARPKFNRHAIVVRDWKELSGRSELLRQYTAYAKASRRHRDDRHRPEASPPVHTATVHTVSDQTPPDPNR